MTQIKIATIIFLMALLVGCVPGSWVMHDPAELTPEQLEAMKGLGYDAVRCATVKGPPADSVTVDPWAPKPSERLVRLPVTDEIV